MKKSKFTESQIIRAPKENAGGRSVEQISREPGINKVIFYRWRKRYGGMDLRHIKELKELRLENSKLKQMYIDQALQLEMAKDVFSKKW